VIDVDLRKAPFQHDGRPGSILDVLLAHGVPLEHACGGSCACTTCHVIVKQGFDRLSEAQEDEEDLLDKAPGLTPTSRLGCQAVIQDDDAEIVVVVPRYTINQISGSHG
jgi:2Fe-2S ferredoxin